MKCSVLTPHRYGIREVAERVGAEWEAMGHDVEYVLARGAAARVGPVTIGTPSIAVWWDRQLRRLADATNGYDLIWAHQPLAPRLPTRDPSFWERVVVTFHTTLRAEYELARNGVYPLCMLPVHWVSKTLEARFYRQMERLASDGPQYTVVSPHLRDEIGAFGIDEATYLPNGLGTPDTDTVEPIRDEHDIPADVTLVFNLGSLTPQKRADECARIMRKVTDAADDIYCVMAGKGPLADAVERHTSDRLRRIGYVSEAAKRRWLHDADVFVSLSAYEGMPVACLEALSVGVPVVLSDIPAHRNIVERHETIGRLAGLEPSTVRSAIRALAGRRADVRLPDWRTIAEQYLEQVGPGVEQKK